MKKEIHWQKFYHGTTKANAKIIEKEGFKRGTFFSTHLESAVGFGGRYVFEVSMKLDFKPTYWEYVSERRIPARQIIRLCIVDRKILFHNAKLGDRMFTTALTSGLIKTSYLLEYLGV